MTTEALPSIKAVSLQSKSKNTYLLKFDNLKLTANGSASDADCRNLISKDIDF